MYSAEEAKELVLKAGEELCDAGLVARTWGNISAKVSDTQYVITPSGRAYDALKKGDIVPVNLEDGSYEGSVKPSGEKGVHAVVYELRPDINFVIHTHQNYASALSILGRDIDVKVPDSEAGGSGTVIPCAEYGMYATKELADHIKEKIKKYPCSGTILMKNHGALCFGKNYEEAFAAAYELENISEKIYGDLCKNKEKSYSALNNKKDSWQKEMSAERLEKILKKTEEAIKRERGSQVLLHVQTPFVKKMSCFGKTIFPFLDDMAQIIGENAGCVKLLDASETEEESVQKIVSQMAEKNAVLLQGMGAVCTGCDEEEASAAAVVFEKACMAAYLAECMEGVRPLEEAAARKDRETYINYYSKLK